MRKKQRSYGTKERKLEDKQCGFMQTKRTTDALFALRKLVETGQEELLCDRKERSCGLNEEVWSSKDRCWRCSGHGHG